MEKRWLEDYAVGEKLVSPARTITEADVHAFAALTGDWHPIHTDAPYAAASLFDEVLGSATNLAPPPGVTAKLEVRYRHVTPIEEELRFEAWVHDNRQRRVEIRATCHAGDTLTADAVGWFVRVDFAEVRERMASRRDGRSR